MSLENLLNYFEQKYFSLIERNYSCDEASLEVIEAYLAGKPISSKKQNKVNKDNLFWSSKVIWDFSTEVLTSNAFVLALSRYFAQGNTTNFYLLEHITKNSPSSVCKGIRQSEVVLRPQSYKFAEIKKFA